MTRLHVYHGGELAATFDYGHAPVYHGASGRRLRAAVEALAHAVVPHGPVPPEVPADWLRWAAAVVYPALASGACVLWLGSPAPPPPPEAAPVPGPWAAAGAREVPAP